MGVFTEVDVSPSIFCRKRVVVSSQDENIEFNDFRGFKDFYLPDTVFVGSDGGKRNGGASISYGSEIQIDREVIAAVIAGATAIGDKKSLGAVTEKCFKFSGEKVFFSEFVDI